MKSILFVIGLLFSYNVSAQSDSCQKAKDNQLSVGLDFLTHGEIQAGGLPRRKNDEVLVEDKSSFLLGRTRLIVDYERKGLSAHVVIQNKAVWGTKNNLSLNLYEGWVKMAANCGLFAQVGRIALAYDDERIIGPNDFAMAALSHDVLRVGYEGYGHKAHAILGYNQNGSNVYANTYYVDGAQNYKLMQTLWYHYDVPNFPLGASLLFMNVGMQAGVYNDVDGKKVINESNPPRTEYQQMLGCYLKYAPKYLTLEGSYYRQFGQYVNDQMQSGKIKAWMTSAKATVKPTDKYRFEVGYDYLSGDEYVPVIYGGTTGLPLHSVEGGFCPLYGSRTKFYGIMDYFYESAYINGFTPGLQNVTVGGFFKPISKLTCQAYYHYLATATALHGLDRTLGHAIDLQAKYEFTKDISLVASYTQMIGTETMNRLKQGNCDKNAQWGWFSLYVSPTLFTTKW